MALGAYMHPYSYMYYAPHRDGVLHIERAQKLDAKPYDGSGDPEAAWSWLDRVNKIYGVMGCTDDQRVMFSSFLMKDKAKDWWDAVDRRHPDGISWDQF